MRNAWLHEKDPHSNRHKVCAVITDMITRVGPCDGCQDRDGREEGASVFLGSPSLVPAMCEPRSGWQKDYIQGKMYRVKDT